MSRGAVASDCGDQFAVEPHHLRRLVDLGARLRVAHSRIGRQHLHALRFENDERRFVNSGDLIFRKNPHRLERIAQMAVGPRAIEDGVTRLGVPPRRRLRRPSVSSGCFMCSDYREDTASDGSIVRRHFCIRADRFFRYAYPYGDAFIRYAQPAPMTHERPAGRRRAHDRLGEVIRSGTHVRELLGHAGVDVRIGRAGAARRASASARETRSA